MSVTISKAGPYFSSGSISFSSLRDTFRLTGGMIKASELKRNTNVNDTNPIVPDATENSSISSGSNLSLSQFRNSIKYYYMTQTGTDINFNISSQNWNSNLNKNILKWLYITGTCGSNNPGSSAAYLNSVAYNLRIEVSGDILGASGPGGTVGSPNGVKGGDALTIAGGSVVVFLSSSSKIYGGGGGGEVGFTGDNGQNGECLATTVLSGCGTVSGCPSGYSETGAWGGGCCQTYNYCCGLFNCACVACSQYQKYRSCELRYAVAGGLGGSGGSGGNGRGYDNQSGSLSGSAGQLGTSAGTCTSGGSFSITPTDGSDGGSGGSGGEWGLPGEGTTSPASPGAAGNGISGSGYTVTGSTGNIKGSK